MVRPVGFGYARDCTVMAGTAVMNRGGGTTTITGDVSISPGTTVSGFPPGQVRGSIDRDNAEARNEKAAAVAAYNDAAGRTPTATLAPQLGGRTLPSGVYDTPGGVFELAGTLTLDAEGNKDAVFIFQADSALNTARVSNIDLVNGAQPDNVVWQVGGSATLGRYSTFRGNILANRAVAVTTGTAFYGRAMALNDMVMLEGTTYLPATRVTWPNNPATATTLTSSPNPSRKGEPVTFVATVTGNYLGFPPSNEVLFRDGDTVVGSATIDAAGQATFTTSGLTRGGHQITAVYVDGGTAVNEDWAQFAPSTSAVVTQVVMNR
ncbi:ice-binding family protein [Sphaerisporangium perillae]|uniref:ice-binding family protein n=1 Tax=Sphaerisporangium perillae TaxID=2935860 RepID=UPI00200C586A|nr:ice-binding family protein [Sphaerisporangium perillae]